MSKKLSLLILVAAVVAAGLVTKSTLAATTGNVTATVTAENISVTLDKAAVSFGTIQASSTKDTTASGVNDSITATNNGNILEDFNIQAANTANWTLAGAADVETYTMKYCVTDCDGTPVWASVGTSPAYVQFADSVAGSGGTQVFDLQVGMPTSTATFTQQSITVTVQAVAHS